MPYRIRKRGTGFEVVNATTGKVHAKHTTRAKAEAQVRLLESVDHGYKPDRVAHLSNGTRVNVYYVGKGKTRHG